jgi:propanol-preferring alcohol dehydrogenase
VTASHEGVAAVIVCTASNASYAHASDFCQIGGTVVCLGIPEGERKPIANADPSTLIERNLHILASSVGNRKDAADMLEMASRGIVKTHFELRPLHQLEQVFREMDEATLQGRVVLDLQQA